VRNATKAALAFLLAPLVALVPANVLCAATVHTITYLAPSGSVSSTLYITMNLAGGGHAYLSPAVGPNCYLGTTCGFPAGYVATSMSLALPDGSSAVLPDFHGAFQPIGATGSGYEVRGQASGIDSRGRYVVVTGVHAEMSIRCRSGRGGGCAKLYVGGALTLYHLAAAPATATPTRQPPRKAIRIPAPTASPGDS